MTIETCDTIAKTVAMTAETCGTIWAAEDIAAASRRLDITKPAETSASAGSSLEPSFLTEKQGQATFWIGDCQ